MTFFKYTPALLDPKTLEDTLVGRDVELNNIKRILKAASSGQSMSHAILIGPKGIGKTHLLRIIYHGVRGEIKTKELNRYKGKFVPLIFPEEEYCGSFMKCFMLIFQYLAELETTGIPPIPEELIKPATLNYKQKEIAVSYIKTFKKKTGKMLLLLIDNFNDIVERFTEEDQSSLREVLMNYDGILFIGSAPTLFDSIINHEKPLYNFFEVVWLKDLPFEATVDLLKRYAGLEGRDDLIKTFEESKPKLRAIHELTGGNPRLILSLYHIAVEGDISLLETTFLKILDELSSYFRERMKDLSAQQSEIIDVIARSERLLTPTEIAALIHLPVNVVNSQITRLEKIGYVRKSPQIEKKRVLYDLNEKLFSLWRQMRVDAGRRRLGFIVKFYEIWFTKEELFSHLDQTLKEIQTKLSSEFTEIQHDIDRLWYIKEAIDEFKGDNEICVVCRRGQYDVALTIINNKLKVKPQDTNMLNMLGCILNRVQKFSEAAEAYEKATEINSNDNVAWYNLAYAYTRLKKNKEAAQAYKKALDIKPDDYRSWYNLGNTCIRLEKYEEAIQAYNKVLDIKPDNYESVRNLGGAYSKLEKYEEAIKAYKKALDIKSDDHETWYALGNTYAMKLKRYEDALEAYKKAVEIKSDDERAWNNLGNTYHELGRYNEAIRAYDKAIVIEPDDYGAWNNLGSAYAELKRYDEAAKTFRKALEVNPDADKSLKNILQMYKILFTDEAIKGNIDIALKRLEELLALLNSVSDKDKLYEFFIASLKKMISRKKIDAVKISLKEIEASNQTALNESLTPYRTLIKYLETRDREIIDRLRHEERVLVEDMLKMLEDKSKKIKKSGRVKVTK